MTMGQMPSPGREQLRLNQAPLVALLAAGVISLVGNMLAALALPWFVLQTTGSASRAGMIGFAVFLPSFLAGMFGGPLVDRFGFRRVSVLADIVSGLSVAAIPLLYHTIGLAFWQLIVLVFLGALLDVPGLTARRSMLPEIAASTGVRLERVNAAFESIGSAAVLIGPPIAGVLISRMGPSNLLWLDAATFAVSILLVVLFVPTGPPHQASAPRARYLDELLGGLRFIRRDRLLLPMAIALGLANALTGSMIAVVLPVYAHDVLESATELGLLVAASGAGMLLGATLYGMFGQRLSRTTIWLGAFLLSPLEYWALAASPPLAALLLALFVSGVLIGPINPLMVTIRHERSPAELRGRVFSTYSAIAMAASPFGVLLTGYAIQGLGFRPTVLLIAIGLEILGIAMLFVPAFRDMQSPVESLSEVGPNKASEAA
jgi:MFS family permease